MLRRGAAYARAPAASRGRIKQWTRETIGSGSIPAVSDYDASAGELTEGVPYDVDLARERSAGLPLELGEPAAQLGGTTMTQGGVAHVLRHAPADNRVDIVRELIGVAERPPADDSPELAFVARKRSA